MRLLLRVDQDRVCSVLPHWTELVAPDPEVVIGGGRAVARVVDLLDLAEFIKRLVGDADGVAARKGNDVVNVSANMPRRSYPASRYAALLC
jgi:hypothetical protein